MSEPDLTPTEELMMEVLIARHRLGEPWWTFSSRPAIVKAARSLQDQGLVSLLSSQVQKTFRVELTQEYIKGMSEYLSPAEKRWLNADTEKVKERLREIFDL